MRGAATGRDRYRGTGVHRVQAELRWPEPTLDRPVPRRRRLRDVLAHARAVSRGCPRRVGARGEHAERRRHGRGASHHACPSRRANDRYRQPLGVASGSANWPARRSRSDARFHDTRAYYGVTPDLGDERDSGFRSMDEVIAASERRPLIFGSRLRYGRLPEYRRNVGAARRERRHRRGIRRHGRRRLAAIRGEVDLIANNFESLLQWVESGDLRPILQISDERMSPHKALDGVPTLGGEMGWAARRAARLADPPTAHEPMQPRSRYCLRGRDSSSLREDSTNRLQLACSRRSH